MLYIIFFIYSTILLSIGIPFGVTYFFIISNLYLELKYLLLFLANPFYIYLILKIEVWFLIKSNLFPDARYTTSYLGKENLDRNNSKVSGFEGFVLIISIIVVFATSFFTRDLNESYHYSNFGTNGKVVVLSKYTYTQYTRTSRIIHYVLNCSITINKKKHPVEIETQKDNFDLYKEGEEAPVYYSSRNIRIIKIKQ